MNQKKEIGDATFQKEVTDFKGLVLVDFWASWCPPCKMMEPMIQRLSTEVTENQKIVTSNIDRNPGTASHYKIQSLPTFIAFSNGVEMHRLVGAATEKQLRTLLNCCNKAA